jgi:hypothetical protein
MGPKEKVTIKGGAAEVVSFECDTAAHRSCLGCAPAVASAVDMATKKSASDEATTTVYTLRFTQEERALVGRLIEARAAELREATGQDLEVTISSYLRWLIERDAQARGLSTKPARRK